MLAAGSEKIKFTTTKDTKFQERNSAFPSCTFVPFVVMALPGATRKPGMR